MSRLFLLHYFAVEEPVFVEVNAGEDGASEVEFCEVVLDVVETEAELVCDFCESLWEIGVGADAFTGELGALVVVSVEARAVEVLNGILTGAEVDTVVEVPAT